MEIIKNNSKLYDDRDISKDIHAVASLRYDIVVDKENAQDEFDYLKRKIESAIIERQEAKYDDNADRVRANMPQFTTCPITNVPIDGTIDSKTAIELGLISKYDRRIMKSNDKTLTDPYKFHDYNKFYCTTKYTKKIDNIEKKHKLITIKL